MDYNLEGCVCVLCVCRKTCETATSHTDYMNIYIKTKVYFADFSPSESVS